MREGGIGQLYEEFLELPVLVVLLAQWLVGGTRLGACGRAVHLLWAGSEVKVERGSVGHKMRPRGL